MDLDELLDAAREGESWAGLALVTQLMPTLLSYVKDIAGDLSTADQEDSIERAITRSIDSIERYDAQRASFPTWVRGYVRYAVADIRRAKGGDVALDEAHLPQWLEEVNSGEPSGDSSLPEGLTWPLLELPVTDQVIIALRDFEGLNYEQCARRIGGGVTEGACRVRHHRALGRLRAILEGDPTYQHLTGAIQP
jgi:RNA polymerase sigma factor (sigma-70 family)